jgi:diadenosine tetraphosphate (Ap4A) HIT family hydrolase
MSSGLERVDRSTLEIPARLRVLESEHWLISHRMDSALPGYLMVGSRTVTDDLSALPMSALSALGPLLARMQYALQCILKAHRVYIGRYGHTPGYPIHFHVIPIYDWVENLFWKDARYRALEDFAEFPGAMATDGAELTFFVWREFCERSVPPPIEGPSVSQAVELIKQALHYSPIEDELP